MEGARLYSFIAAFTDPEGSDSPDALIRADAFELYSYEGRTPAGVPQLDDRLGGT